MKYLLTFLSFLLVGCQLFDEGTPDAAENTVTSWADAYFNYDYEEALKYTTPESEKWIRFAASNITEKDVDFIRQQGNKASAEVQSRQIAEGDTVGTVDIRVSNYVQLGAIGKENKVVNEGIFSIRVVKRSGKWQVRMEALPRNERQSRD